EQGMSGSGSAVFGVFTSSRRAKKCYDKLCESYKEVFLSQARFRRLQGALIKFNNSD
ncbi:hypothetical protein OBE_13623, partial [human gut metagenome]